MNCKNYQKQIISYLDGEPHEVMANALIEHLKGCQSCKNVYSSLSKVYSIVDSEKSEFKADPFMSARVLAKIENKNAKYTIREVSLRYLTIAGLAAAGIAFGILIGSLYSSSSYPQTSTQEWDQLAEEYMPDIENNPYNMITILNETPAKP